VRVPSWTLLLLLFLLAAGLTSYACGGGSNDKGQAGLTDIPTATLPSSLPDPLIVSGTPRPSTSGNTYVVKDGDNPSSIADQFGISVEELMAANDIVDPTDLHVGDELVIPGGAVLGDQATPRPSATEQPAEATPTEQPAQPTATPSSGQQTYTVQDGDYPESIAAQFGITADALMAANGITDPASLQVGQVLIIPAPAE
jgi:LysM repeat protein